MENISFEHKKIVPQKSTTNTLLVAALLTISPILKNNSVHAQNTKKLPQEEVIQSMQEVQSKLHKTLDNLYNKETLQSIEQVLHAIKQEIQNTVFEDETNKIYYTVSKSDKATQPIVTIIICEENKISWEKEENTITFFINSKWIKMKWINEFSQREKVNNILPIISQEMAVWQQQYTNYRKALPKNNDVLFLNDESINELNQIDAIKNLALNQNDPEQERSTKELMMGARLGRFIARHRLQWTYHYYDGEYSFHDYINQAEHNQDTTQTIKIQPAIELIIKGDSSNYSIKTIMRSQTGAGTSQIIQYNQWNNDNIKEEIKTSDASSVYRAKLGDEEAQQQRNYSYNKAINIIPALLQIIKDHNTNLIVIEE